MIGRVVKAIVGLFWDDGSLAIALLVLLAAMIVTVKADLLASSTAMLLLVTATVLILLENVVRSVARGNTSN